MSINQPLTLAISGMSCGHCVAAVTAALRAVPGLEVQGVSVGSATVALDGSATAGTAIDAIREAGYDAEIKTNSAGHTPSRAS